MKNRLSKDTMDYISTLEISPGQQFKGNHIDCPAGEDTRERLNVRLSEDNRLLLAHCFNCGGSGVRATKGGSRFLSRSTIPDSDKLGLLYKRYDEYMDLYRISLPIAPSQEWPAKYFQDCWPDFIRADKFGIREGATYYILPRGEFPTSITGFEVRNKYAKEYLRIVHPMFVEDSKVLIYNKDMSDVAVICEDPISAMKVSLAGYGGVSLCGSVLSQDDAHKLTLLFDKFLVWLDNDSEIIKAQALQAFNRLGLYADDVKIESVFKDPKGLVLEHLRERIYRSFST